MKTFYNLDSTRITFREYLFGTPWLLAPLIAVIKLLHIRVPSSTDDPSVASLAPFEVDEEKLPAEVRSKMEPLAQELAELGFGRPIFHLIHDPLHFSSIYWATLLHNTGRSVARIHHRVWSHPRAYRSYLFPVYLSELEDGSFVVSWAGKPDLIAPASVRMHYKTGASSTELWEVHEGALDDVLPRQPVCINSPERLREMLERHHAAVRDFHLSRGVFKPLSAAQQEELTAQSDEVSGTTPAERHEQQVLARLEQLQTQKPSWGYFLLILALSLFLFIGAGRLEASWEFVLLLIPVLLFHELGHYLAMRVFGYRNLRMFFIPFLGAAVMGKHYNVPGWKKAVVALMGPVPGIVLAAGIGVPGLILGWNTLMDVAAFMLILNGFNLLPFMPLDGGWVLHAVLFCRHPLLDLAFRLLAILGLAGLGLVLDGRLYLVALLLLISLPASWRIAKTAQVLRRRGDLAISPNDISIPPQTALTILSELQAGRSTRLPVNVLVQYVASVFETLNARPPGFAGSLGLLTIHGGSFMAALVFLVVLFVGRFGLPASPDARTGPVDTVGANQQWRGPDAPTIPPEASVTIIATYANPEAARADFAALPTELPREATLHLFGWSVLLTLPPGQDVKNKWVNRLEQCASESVVDRKQNRVWVDLSCTMPSEQEAGQLASELRVYLRFFSNKLLIPPWSAAWQALPEGDRQRYQKARRTLDRLQQMAQQAAMHPDVRALRKRLAEVKKPPEDATTKRLRQALRRSMLAEQKRLLATIAADTAGTDQVMLELWQRWLKLAERMANVSKDAQKAAQPGNDSLSEQNALWKEMTQCLGPLPLVGNQLQPGSELEAASFGFVTQQGRSVSIQSIQFTHISKGLPALADWLGRRHGSDMRYHFQSRQRK